MRIAVSSQGDSMDSLIDPRFGRSQGFIVYDQKVEKYEYVDNRVASLSPQGAGLAAAKAVIDAGASVVITGRVGPKAANALLQAGVAVYEVSSMPSVQEALHRYDRGVLRRITAGDVREQGFGSGMRIGRGMGGGGGRGMGGGGGQGQGGRRR